MLRPSACICFFNFMLQTRPVVIASCNEKNDKFAAKTECAQNDTYLLSLPLSSEMARILMMGLLV